MARAMASKTISVTTTKKTSFTSRLLRPAA
jgi:hypothetical protein